MCRDAVNCSAEVGIYLTNGDFGTSGHRSSKLHDVADGCVSNCVSVFYGDIITAILSLGGTVVGLKLRQLKLRGRSRPPNAFGLSETRLVTSLVLLL